MDKLIFSDKMKKGYRFIILLLLLLNPLVTYAYREPMTHGYYPDDEPRSHVSSGDITAFLNFVLLIVVIVLAIKGIKRLVDYFYWKKREKDAAIIRAIQEEEARKEKERESLKEFWKEFEQRREKRKSEAVAENIASRSEPSIIQASSSKNDNIGAKEECKQSFLANQSVFCNKCMDLSWEKKCRFFFSTAIIPESGNGKVAADCRVACLYLYECNKCSDVVLLNGYVRANELNSMNIKEDNSVYEKYLQIIEHLKRLSNNNVVVLFTIPNKRNWKKFKSFHYSYFISELNRLGIYHTDSFEDSALSKKGVTIIIFSLTLKKRAVFEIIPNLITEHLSTNPSFVYLTVCLETDKNGRPYLINNTKLPSNDF